MRQGGKKRNTANRRGGERSVAVLSMFHDQGREGIIPEKRGQKKTSQHLRVKP